MVLKFRRAYESLFFRAKYRASAVSTMNYVGARLADLADVSIAVIITRDFGSGEPNAYVYGLLSFLYNVEC